MAISTSSIYNTLDAPGDWFKREHLTEPQPFQHRYGKITVPGTAPTSKFLQTAERRNERLAVMRKSICSVIALGHLEDMVGERVQRRMWEYAKDSHVGESALAEDLMEICYRVGFPSRSMVEQAVRHWDEGLHERLMTAAVELAQTLARRPHRNEPKWDMSDDESLRAKRERERWAAEIVTRWGTPEKAQEMYREMAEKVKQIAMVEAARQEAMEAARVAAREKAAKEQELAQQKLRERAEAAQADLEGVVDELLKEDPALGSW